MMSDTVWIIGAAVLLLAAFLPTVLVAAQYVSSKRNQLKTVTALSQIHILVNSNLTEAKRRELDAVRVMLAALREVATIKETIGVPVSPQAREVMTTAELRIDELASEVAHKQDQTDIADEQAERKT